MRDIVIENLFNDYNRYVTDNTLNERFELWFDVLTKEIESYSKEKCIELLYHDNNKFNYITDYDDDSCENFHSVAVIELKKLIKRKLSLGRYEFRGVKKFENYLIKWLLKILYYKNLTVNKRLVRKGKIAPNFLINYEENEEYRNNNEDGDEVGDGDVNLTEDIENLFSTQVDEVDDHPSYTNYEKELRNIEISDIPKIINLIKEVYSERFIRELFHDFDGRRFEICILIFYSYHKYKDWKIVHQKVEELRNENNTNGVRALEMRSSRCKKDFKSYMIENEERFVKELIRISKNPY